MENAQTFIGAAVGLAIGGAAGYFAAYKILEKKFDERLEEETKQTREFYTQATTVSNKKPYRTPEEAVADLIPGPDPENEDPRQKSMKIAYHRVVKGEGYVEAVGDEEEGAMAAAEEAGVPKPMIRNVFKDARDPEFPYVIDQDEFMQNEPGFEQGTLSYFAKGGVLVDDHDTPIDNADVVIGTDFATRFGEGSSDENVVHIRNEKLRMDFEVCRSENSYEEDVLGESENPETPRERRRREQS
jgi:hypothetical protein